MSNNNMFQEVMDNPQSAKEKYIGSDYPYYKYIKTPKEIGMSSKGTLPQLGKDVDGLVSYVELLVSGKGKASATGQPLGNKFFLKTGSKCTDNITKQEVDRYVYINNVPQGNIPFISSGMGVNFSEFKGLIPGTISNLNSFNPMEMFQAFLAGSKPDCQEVKMETIDIYNNKSTESHFIALMDIKNIDPCSFPDKKNPLTNASCRETFSNINLNQSQELYNQPNQIFANLYFASLGMLGIYIMYRIMLKNKMLPKFHM
jgi:hypothetical protein